MCVLYLVWGFQTCLITFRGGYSIHRWAHIMFWWCLGRTCLGFGPVFRARVLRWRLYWRVSPAGPLLMVMSSRTLFFKNFWNAPSNIFFVIRDGKGMFWLPFEGKIKFIILWTEFSISYFGSLARVRLAQNLLVNMYGMIRIWFWLFMQNVCIVSSMRISDVSNYI